ncbi:hypothetical protein [Lysinibacillus fusiformis]|nr:hypothetical protein [Lysinibacillus fusiformis]
MYGKTSSFNFVLLPIFITKSIYPSRQTAYQDTAFNETHYFPSEFLSV